MEDRNTTSLNNILSLPNRAQKSSFQIPPRQATEKKIKNKKIKRRIVNRETIRPREQMIPRDVPLIRGLALTIYHLVVGLPFDSGTITSFRAEQEVLLNWAKTVVLGRR